jgi:DNA-binding NarL/FixJ family response regulator
MDEPPLKLDDGLQASLRSMAENHDCSENDVVSELIYNALARKTVELESNMEFLHRWETLTPREQQVTVLICGGLTNQQMAVRLKLSPATIKVYVRQALGKLGFHSKRELRIALEGWISSRK